MPKTPIRILTINPGTKYLGIAYFQEADLRDWAIKVIVGKWSKSKLIKIQAVITELVFRYQPDTIVLKSVDPSRRSKNLSMLVGEIKDIAMRKGIAVEEYSIEDLKRYYSPEKRINKKQLAEMVATEYSVLFYELERDKSHKNEYFSRLFEAVSLGVLCLNKLMPKST